MLDLVRKIIKKERIFKHNQPKPLLVSVLHCLYEAQDPSLCQFAVEQLEGELNLNSTSLTPVASDCLAVGYFLSSVSLTASSVKQFTVNLTRCLLGDAGTKSLVHVEV